MHALLRWIAAPAALLLPAVVNADESLRVTLDKQRLVITAGAQPLASYVFHDEQILRPYFTAVHAPGGQEVTRRHPPREGTDPTDHATMHPGIWLAFGDLGGADFWRNKGRVEHERFVTEPSLAKGVLRFAVRNRYVAGPRVVCHEDASYSLSFVGSGYLLTWDSIFTGSDAFAFGDQEEMGLGIRLATPLCVTGGSGSITTSRGKRNEKEAWGTTTEWCDYSGISEGRRAGMLLIPHPDNFRPSWLHVRDYGLAVANPFGRQALKRGEASRIEVKPGQSLRLRFGVWIYAVDAEKTPDFAAIVAEYTPDDRG